MFVMTIMPFWIENWFIDLEGKGCAQIDVFAWSFASVISRWCNRKDGKHFWRRDLIGWTGHYHGRPYDVREREDGMGVRERIEEGRWTRWWGLSFGGTMEISSGGDPKWHMTTYSTFASLFFICIKIMLFMALIYSFTTSQSVELTTVHRVITKDSWAQLLSSLLFCMHKGIDYRWIFKAE